jgi:transposase
MTRAMLGIDVSKKKLDVALLFGNTDIRKKTFANDEGGFEKLMAWVKRYHGGDIHACTEFTGVYDEGIAGYLYKKGHRVSRINAMSIKCFAESKLTRTKTDAKDSMIIAQYCKLYDPSPWVPAPLHITDLKDLSRTLEALKEHYQLICNKLEKYEKSNSPAKKIWQDYLTETAKKIKDIDKQLDHHIKGHPDLEEKMALLQTISGIGKTTARTLLAEIPDIRNFKDARQLAAFAGLTPRQRQSGSSVHGHSRLSKIGSKRLRKALYFPAIVAKTYNPVIANFFNKLLQRGKCKMSALAAAMRKLIHIVFGVLHNQLPFEEKMHKTY